jgi:hypothetical protein
MTADLVDPRLFDEPTPISGHLTAASPLPVSGPRAVRRVTWLDLDSEWYPGFQLKVWLNPSHMQKRLSETGDAERVSELIKFITLEHNGWCDEDGEPYPPANTPAFWEAIPADLGVRIVTAINAELTNLPNSAGARNGS